MPDVQWKRVMAEEEVKEGVLTAAQVEDNKILLVRLQGKIYAGSDECTHYHCSLHEGVLRGPQVTCPCHNARFDLRSGEALHAPALNDLPMYAVRTEGGQVYVRLEASPAIPMPQGKDGRTFLIVGAGAAGNAAAETLRRRGFAGRIVMITREPRGPYDRTMLSKGYLSGEEPAKWLPLRGEKFYGRLSIELMTGQEVVALDPASRTVSLRSGRQLEGDAILLATGGIPRSLPIAGAGLPGCFLLRSVEDADALISAAEKASRAVIVGASFIGLEVAAALRKRGLEVAIVAPESLPLARLFGDEVGRTVQRRHEENEVRFHLGRTVKAFHGNGGLREVELDEGTRLPADMVVIGVGVRPAVEFLAQSGLVKDGAVPVDERLQTGAPGIFAAGDIALLPDPVGGERRRVEHWVEAERQGQHAGRCMLGAREPYRKLPFFWTRQYGSSLKYIGWTPGFDSIAMRKGEGGEFIAGYYLQGRLRAAACIGNAQELIRLGLLLEQGKGIAAEQLEDPDFDLRAL
jgi:NADPH-dependent 2,4-dienoyl-CoA reductase/sulfur reductase-like enzyme/nitrite reductase/ring-hydroxylating ferredoxin subunit